MVMRHWKRSGVFLAKSFSDLHKYISAARYKVHVGGCSCSKLDSVQREAGQWVVVPEIKNAASKAVFLFRPSSHMVNDVELELKEHIFNKNENIFNKNDPCEMKPEQGFKISCASCLLKRNQPNGFLCLCSNDQRSLNLIRDECRNRSKFLSNNESLHDDHAHYICTLSRKSLDNLLQLQSTIKKNYKKSTVDNTTLNEGLIQAFNSIFTQMKSQKIPVSMLSHHVHSKQQQNEEKINTISLGHHLETLLRITKSDERINSHWLVLMYDDRKTKKSCWTLDIPGGKRHLGETSLQGALREAKEEISFDMDELDFQKWLHYRSDGNIIEHKEKKVLQNVYFMATPPQDEKTDLCKVFEQNLTVENKPSKHISSLQRALLAKK